MPNVTYSGTQGIVQSSGTGGFTVQGVGIALDVETITGIADDNTTLKAYGVSKVATDNNGNREVTVENPVDVTGAAGQTKLIVKTDGNNEVAVRSVATNAAGLVGDSLNNANDYILLMWTGTDWVCVADATA